VTAVALALAAAAMAVLLGRDATGGQRLAGLRATPRPGRVVVPATVACVLAAAAVAVVVGGVLGMLLGLVVGVAGPRALAGLEPAAARREREQLVAELPLLLDLLGACLAGGASLPRAASAVAAALPGPCGRRLAAVVDSFAVGAPPEQAWLALGGGVVDDPLGPAARVLARAGEGGTPVAATVRRLAADARAAGLAAGSQAARRVGVLVVAPLGLCFLPAFVLLGVVPVVVGLAAPLFRTF
jgi:pilus assembly protein TadC